MTDRNRYVVGFVFNEGETKVLLIAKNREPEGAEMIGTFNGIGGKVRPRESYHDAMIREFQQEAGVIIPFFDLFAIIDGADYRVFCYTASVAASTWRHIRTLGASPTDEMTIKVSVRSVLTGNANVPSRVTSKAKAGDANPNRGDGDDSRDYYPDVPSLVAMALHPDHWRARAIHIDRRAL